MLAPVNLPTYRGVLRQVDLAIYQGDTWGAIVAVNNPDGTPADLTGSVANAQIRTGPADQAIEVAAEFETSVTGNQVSLGLSSEQTVLLGEQDYCWDLEIVGPDGLSTTTILAGQVMVTLEVTRETPVEEVIVVAEIRDPYRGLFI